MEASLPIPISQYVLITSAVGGGANVSTRNLGGLVVTGNPLCPSGTIVNFASALAVGNFFGTASEEYARAEFYFSYISKNGTQANQISFWYWNGDQNTGSLIYGLPASYAVSQFTGITTGDFTLTLGGYTDHVTGISFSAAGSLASVAADMQTAIRAVTAGSTAWTSATVTYNALTSQFNLVSGAIGTDVITVAAGTNEDVAGPLGWLTGAILSNGTNAQAVSDNLNSLIQISNNFGSLCYEYGNIPRAVVTADFYTPGIMSVSAVTSGQLAIGDILAGTGLPTGTKIVGLGTGTTGTGTYSVNTVSTFTLGAISIAASLPIQLSEIESAATWNNSLSPNNQFLFSVATSTANASAWAAALATTGGVCATLLSPQSGAYPEMEPMAIEAATDYTARNAVQNYMFQQFNDTASVTTSAQAAIYDALLVNYYGVTETAGQNLSFYQPGVMFGLATQPSDIGVYVNELWLKDAIQASIMTLLLSVAQVPANSTGQAMLTAQILSIVQQALFNGTISVGKTLTSTQKLYITQATGSATAWQQVQTSGYWLNVVILPYVTDGITEYKAVYTLIYSKADSIRLVIGQDILI